MIAHTVEIEGTLQADGKLILDGKPALPPGRVRVALQLLLASQTGPEHLPDMPWPDESISAPLDLPRAGVIVRVRPRIAPERLPALPIEGAEEAR